MPVTKKIRLNGGPYDRCLLKVSYGSTKTFIFECKGFYGFYKIHNGTKGSWREVEKPISMRLLSFSKFALSLIGLNLKPEINIVFSQIHYVHPMKPPTLHV